MASYKDVQTFVKKRHGIVVQTCWIAHVKELNGLPLRSTRTGEQQAFWDRRASYRNRAVGRRGPVPPLHARGGRRGRVGCFP